MTRELEIQLAKQVEEGREAARRLADFGWESEEDRAVMAKKISDGRQAEGRLVLSNLRLVTSIARKVMRRFANFYQTSLTLEDLLQEGDIGLMYAIERFDWRKGYRFSTYSSYWIRQMMRVAIMNTGTMIRIPLSRRHQIMRMKRAETLYELQKGRKPTAEQLSKIIGMKEDVGRSVYDLSKKDFSVRELDKGMSGEGTRGNSFLSMVRDDDDLPLQKLEQEEAWARAKAELTREMKDKLMPDELQAVTMRYGLDGDEKATYREIAETMGLPSDSIAQNKVYNAVQKLKRWTRHRRKEDLEVLDVL